MKVFQFTLGKAGLIKLLTGGTVVVQDQSNLLDPFEVRLVLHPECKNLVSVDTLTR